MQPLRRLLCNALIQPHFDFACSAWYPNLNNRLQSMLQILQNKCIRYCLNLDSKAYIGLTEFEKKNWLPMTDSNTVLAQWSLNNSITWVLCVWIMYIFKLTGQNTTTTMTSLSKLSQPLKKANHRQKRISYVVPSMWHLVFGINFLIS